MSWRMFKLDDCLELITYGFTNPMPDSEHGPWKVTAKDIANGRIDFSTARHTTEEAFTNDLTDKSRPIKDDILLTKDGTLGRLAIVGEEQICINQSVALLRLKKHLLLPRYLLYLLQTPEYQGKMMADAGGSTIKHIYITKVNQLLIPVPPLDKQQEIIDVLLAYDSMIDNCNAQIKLLEEAAQRLYKEWFVDLRFPGYENTTVVDGVPEGWTLTNINAVMTFHRGYDLTKNSMIPGKYPVVGSTSIIGYHNQYKIMGPGIITGRSGSLGEYQLIWEDYWPHNTALYVSDMKEHHVLYLYSMLQTVDFSGLNNGGAIPTLNRNTLSNIAVIEAPKALQDEYVRIVEPLYSSIRTAKKQIKYLQETRDRLLPKLMNGEIEV